MMSKTWLMNVSAYVMVSVLALVFVISTVSAVPLEDVSSDLDEKSALLSKYMSLMNRLSELRAADLDVSDVIREPFAQRNLRKRYNKPIQSRSGGMSLCLWKVCPAAPWLINK